MAIKTNSQRENGTKHNNDDDMLIALGYKPELKIEFS